MEWTRLYAVTIKGAGYKPGETVKLTYLGGTTTVTLCTGPVAADGTFTCTANIPPASSAGPNGAHAIVAKDVTSAIKAKSTYTLHSMSAQQWGPACNPIGNPTTHDGVGLGRTR